MMRKLLIGIGFILLSFILLFGGLAVIVSILIGASWARSLDKGQLSTGGGCGLCSPSCKVSHFDFTSSSRVLSKEDSQAVNVDIILAPCVTEGLWTLKIDAPQFVISPNPSSQTMNISAHPDEQEIKYGWVLSPQQVGTFAITSILSFQNIPIADEVLGLTVKDIFGLNIWQSQLFSSISSALGTFFAPVTFVWLFNVWKEHKSEKKKKASSVLHISKRNQRKKRY